MRARVIVTLLAAAAGLPAQPKRIVSTAPGITETLFALGLGDRVVGVSQYCRYPPQAIALPKIGSYLQPNVESIVSLRPDLVIVQALPNRLAEQLTRMKLNVLEVEHADLEGTLAAIRKIGERTHTGGRAEQLVSQIRGQLAAIRKKTAGQPRRSLVFIVGRTPARLEGLIAVGKASYLNDLIEIAGGRNALKSAIVSYAKISLESLVSVNPDVIVDMGEMAETVGVTEEQKRAVVALWKRQSSVRAAAAGRVFAVASDIYVVPGPRMVEAAQAFARMLHPEVRW